MNPVLIKLLFFFFIERKLTNSFARKLKYIHQCKGGKKNAILLSSPEIKQIGLTEDQLGTQGEKL